MYCRADAGTVKINTYANVLTCVPAIPGLRYTSIFHRDLRKRKVTCDRLLGGVLREVANYTPRNDLPAVQSRGNCASRQKRRVSKVRQPQSAFRPRGSSSAATDAGQ